MHTCLSAMILCGQIFFLPFSFAQQGADPASSGMRSKVLTPEQQAYQQRWTAYEDERIRLQAQAKVVFETETTREKAGDCTNAETTYGFNICFGKQMALTDQNLKSYEDIVRKLQADPPQMAGEPIRPTIGPAGPVLTQEQLVAEFDRVEEVWERYRESACMAAFHQFAGGTGGPSFEMQCQLKVTRDHMRELDMIYGADLHR